MCEKKNNGGPAFPFTPNEQGHNPDGTWNQSYDPGESGMSLREYFAGQALCGLNASLSNETEWPSASDIQTMVMSSYDQADAMIAEGEK